MSHSLSATRLRSTPGSVEQQARLAAAIDAVTLLQKETELERRRQRKDKKEGREEQRRPTRHIGDTDLHALYPSLFAPKIAAAAPPTHTTHVPLSAHATHISRTHTHARVDSQRVLAAPDADSTVPPRLLTERDSPLRPQTTPPRAISLDAMVPVQLLSHECTSGPSRLYMEFQQLLRENEDAQLYNGSASVSEASGAVSRRLTPHRPDTLEAPDTHRQSRVSAPSTPSSSSASSVSGSEHESSPSATTAGELHTSIATVDESELQVAVNRSRSSSSSTSSSASSSPTVTRRPPSNSAQGASVDPLSSQLGSPSGSSSASSSAHSVASPASQRSNVSTPLQTAASPSSVPLVPIVQSQSAMVESLHQQLMAWCNRYRVSQEENATLEQRTADLEDQLVAAKLALSDRRGVIEDISTPGAPTTSTAAAASATPPYASLHHEQEEAMAALKLENAALQTALAKLQAQTDELQQLQVNSPSEAAMSSLRRENDLDRAQFASMLERSAEQLDAVHARHAELLRRFEDEVRERDSLATRLRQEQRQSVERIAATRRAEKAWATKAADMQAQIDEHASQREHDQSQMRSIISELELQRDHVIANLVEKERANDERDRAHRATQEELDAIKAEMVQHRADLKSHDLAAGLLEQSNEELRRENQELTRRLLQRASAPPPPPVAAPTVAPEDLLREQRVFFESKIAQWQREHLASVRRDVRAELEEELARTAPVAPPPAPPAPTSQTLERVAELEQQVFIYRHQLESSDQARQSLSKDLQTIAAERDDIDAQYQMLRAKFVSSTCLLSRFERWFASKDRHMSEVARIIQDQTGGVFPAESIPSSSRADARPTATAAAQPTDTKLPASRLHFAAVTRTPPTHSQQVDSLPQKQTYRDPRALHDMAPPTKSSRPYSTVDSLAFVLAKPSRVRSAEFTPPYPNVPP